MIRGVTLAPLEEYDDNDEGAPILPPITRTDNPPMEPWADRAWPFHTAEGPRTERERAQSDETEYINP